VDSKQKLNDQSPFAMMERSWVHLLPMCWVNDTVIVELAIAKVHEVQLVNYLVATGLDEGLLLNFGAERLEFKRKFRLPKQDEEVSF
jgi:GxxExxY protein